MTTTQTKGIAGIYARLSSAQQEDGTSLETQVERCEAKARELGYTVEERFIWRETQTGIIIERAVLDKARRAAADGQIAALMVYSSDRLSRDPFHTVSLVREFKAAGVELHFVNGISDSSPEGQLMAYIDGYVGFKEHALIRERTIRGREAAARAGRMPKGMGYGLYGYDYRKGDYERTFNERESPIVKWAFNWADQGWTGYRILTTLNEMNIPTKMGKKWGTKTIKNLLTNRSYIGESYFRGIKIDGFTPPLIDEDLFDRVQERLSVQQARRTANRESRERCLLTGFVSCLTCGNPITGADARYYRCVRAKSRSWRVTTCTGLSLRREKLEGAVWDAVVRAIEDPSVMIAELEESLRANNVDAMQASMENLRREIAHQKSQQEELLDLRLKGQIDRKILDRRLEPITALCREKETELTMLEKRWEQQDDPEKADQRIRELCRAWAEKLDNLDFDEKRATMSAFGVKVKAAKGEPLQVTADVHPGTLIENCTGSRRCPGSCPRFVFGRRSHFDR